MKYSKKVKRLEIRRKVWEKDLSTNNAFTKPGSFNK